MLECQIHGAEDLRVVDVPTPQPGPGEVLVRLGAAGICGSDMHYYFHGRNGSFVIREPLVAGHEASGVVAAVGAGVTRMKAGDRIVTAGANLLRAGQVVRVLDEAAPAAPTSGAPDARVARADAGVATGAAK